MGFKFNPLAFSGFSLTGDGGSNPNYINPVATEGDLPSSPTPSDGALVVVQSTDHIYVYDGSTSKWVDTGVTSASFGSSPSAAGYTLVKDASGAIVRNEITLQPADATHPGGVSTTTQTFAGNKTLTGTTTTSGLLNADGGIDRSTSGTLTIGATNSSTINIGNSGATVNIQGTTIYENTPQLLTADPLITVNHGGGAGSGQNSGIEIEENGSITGYAETSSDRNSWILKAPNTAGIATLTPGASGITLNQSSHNPVTLAAVGVVPNANGASLSTQQLNLQPADGSNPGVLTAGSQTIGGVKTFSNNPVMSGLTASQAVVTDGSKNLASLAYTNINTNSALVQRDGSGNFSAGTITANLTGNVTGTVTGSASLNVLKAGDTMTGPLVMPSSGTASATSINFGTNGTGIYGTSTVTAFSSGNTEIGRFNGNGLLLGTTTADTTAPLHIKQTSTALLVFESSTANTWAWKSSGNTAEFDYTSGTWSPFQFLGAKNTLGFSTTQSGPQYMFEFNTNSTNTSLTSIVPGSSTDFGIVGLRNKNSAVNSMSGILTAGSSNNPMGFAGTIHKTQTASSESSDFIIATQNAGTLTEGFRLSNAQLLKLPAYTTAGLLSNDTSGNITSVTNYAVTGDIAQTSFTAADNQVAAANVTGFTFANASVRGFKAIVSITRASTYAFYTIEGVQRGSDWVMDQSYVGDDTGIVFTITTAGAVQYTSTSTGSTATIKFRAQVLSV